MRALDLFCGLGGWSDGLAMEGFEVLGVEIEPKIAKLYEHDVIIADCRCLPLRVVKWDLVVGSPPCREFSNMLFRSDRWKIPPDPNKGLEMVNAFIDYASKNGIYWLMENNPNLEKYIGKARCKSWLGIKRMRRGFWGNFPSFLIPRSPKERNQEIRGKLKKWERARIPLPVAFALGRAIKSALNEDDA